MNLYMGNISVYLINGYEKAKGVNLSEVVGEFYEMEKRIHLNIKYGIAFAITVLVGLIILGAFCLGFELVTLPTSTMLGGLTATCLFTGLFSMKCLNIVRECRLVQRSAKQVMGDFKKAVDAFQPEGQSFGVHSPVQTEDGTKHTLIMMARDVLYSKAMLDAVCARRLDDINDIVCISYRAKRDRERFDKAFEVATGTFGLTFTKSSIFLDAERRK